MQLSEKTGIKQNVLQAIIKLAKDNDVRKLILFGSRARGDYKERSDIDLAFYGGNSSRFILEVDEETPTLLQFDVLDLDKPIQAELLESIKREGMVIYEKVR
ncbi:MAG TPA: nucleotidyltransferase domain-containing protein [Lachnospiraceae bacterium]|nr:nucleotidyltransferase domain-containing protein [Clostridium sp.]MDY4875173.1 nucleotidyltransferase domain-containing protein [Eubacterium sp.]OLA01758.1 MAG: nucleotidyltransferase [Clostridium sp. CAG:62_40_43]HAY04735.1 nucleotidyltransferase domain-containing protein [Lachnospiraceae bacterium]MCI7502371.1 nucleotidyltransferase domain-containing protein [Clostridium sp.]